MAESKHFASDNHAPAHPAVLAAIAAANDLDADAYGRDALTSRLDDRFGAVFGTPVRVLPVFTGTAANVVSLGTLVPPHRSIVCADTAHVAVDEGGAPERFVGSKLIAVDAPGGKLTPKLIEPLLTAAADPHQAPPGAVSLTQVTEVGTCYSLTELTDLTDFCHAKGLGVHMDGARLANAVAYLGCAPAEVVRGVDLLSFGATKNGGLGAEAVVSLRPVDHDALPHVHMQAMQLASKMRYLSAQLLALLEGELWIANARHANAMARRLADRLTGVDGCRLRYPVEGNAVFPILGPAIVAELRRRWSFYMWDDDEGVARWMTAFDTTPDDVDAFASDVREVIADRRR